MKKNSKLPDLVILLGSMLLIVKFIIKVLKDVSFLGYGDIVMLVGVFLFYRISKKYKPGKEKLMKVGSLLIFIGGFIISLGFFLL